MLPLAYAYPKPMRATRDLLRRRTKLVRVRAEALAHVQNTVSQYNLPPLAKKLCYAANREGVAELFPDESVQRMVQADLDLIGHIDEQLKAVELYLVRHAKIDDPHPLPIRVQPQEMFGAMHRLSSRCISAREAETPLANFTRTSNPQDPIQQQASR